MTYLTTAAVVHEPHGPFSLESVELDTLAPKEVLIDIDACGICHTDAKFQELLPLPGVFGHEGTGTVREVGKEVSQTQAGERVILSYPFCTACPSCSKGEPYRCENIPALKFGGQRLDGSKTIRLNGKPITSSFFQQSSFARAAVVVEQAVVPINQDIEPEMLAALPCGIQTGAGAIFNTFQPEPGDALLVIGAGAVGLSAIMAARVAGMFPIICADFNDERLQLAKELGASHTVNPSQEDLPARVKQLRPRGVRFALDSSASVAGLNNAISSIGQGGQVGIVSYPKGGEVFPFNTRELFLKVANIVSIVQGYSIPRLLLPRLLQLQQAGRFPYQKLISTYAFEDINQAFADTEKGSAVKAVLLMN